MSALDTFYGFAVADCDLGDSLVHGIVVDDDGHRVGGHASSTKWHLRHDLRDLARRLDPSAQFRFLDSPDAAPRCPGCELCAEERE